MGKVAILADVHLGLGTRSDDIFWALNVVSEHCKRNNITEIIIIGDLFHDRESISVGVLCQAFDFFRQCKADGQTWIAFPGNHDMFLKHSWSINSLRPLSDHLTIIEDVKLLKLDDRRFWILPFIYSESAYMKILEHIETMYEPGDVLLTHIGVKSSTLNVCFLIQHWSFVDFSNSKFDRIYAGHFHLHHQVGRNVWYPGSLIPFKFDEGDSTHGFYEYDLVSGEHEFKDIWEVGSVISPNTPMPPQYYTILDQTILQEDCSHVKNNMLRIALTKHYSVSEKDELQTIASNLGAKRTTFLELNETKSHVSTVSDEDSDKLQLTDLFQEWVDSDNIEATSLQRNFLLRLDREIREAGDEIYSALSDDEV